jgi:hypothetical protein
MARLPDETVTRIKQEVSLQRLVERKINGEALMMTLSVTG